MSFDSQETTWRTISAVANTPTGLLVYILGAPSVTGFSGLQMTEGLIPSGLSKNRAYWVVQARQGVEARAELDGQELGRGDACGGRRQQAAGEGGPPDWHPRSAPREQRREEGGLGRGSLGRVRRQPGPGEARGKPRGRGQGPALQPHCAWPPAAAAQGEGTAEIQSVRSRRLPTMLPPPSRQT